MQPADADTKVEAEGKGTKRKSEQDAEREDETGSKRARAQKRRTWWIGCTLKKGTSVTQAHAVSNKGIWGYTRAGNAVRKRRKSDKDEAAFFGICTDYIVIRVKEPEVKGMVINVEVFEHPDNAQHAFSNFLVRDIQFSKHVNLEAAKEAAKSFFYPAHWTRHVFHVCV